MANDYGLIWKLLTEVPQYHIEDINSHRMLMKIQTGHLDGVQSDTNVQLSGLIWPNRAILVKLRMRKCGNVSLCFARQLKFLTLLLELRNPKSIFISDRCANFEPP